MMKITFGCTDKNLYPIDIISHEPHQAYGKNRYLTVSLMEQAVNQHGTAQPFLLGEFIHFF
jgi:hypothetical protein